MKFIKVIALPILVFGGVYSPLFAQTAPADTLRGELEEIVIRAAYSPITIGDAPMSVTTFERSAENRASQRAATMDELTFTMPGISISNRENYALGERMTVRGMGWRSPFGVRGIQVILDGMPLTVADGQTIMNMIEPAMVRRVELLRGPSATFWGNSSGGVLYMSTTPSPDDASVQYRGYGGAFNTWKQELQFQQQLPNGRIHGYGSYFETDGFRDHSAARLIRAGLGSTHTLSARSSLSLRAAYTGMPKAQHPGALTDELSQSSPQQARQNFVDARAGKNFDQAMLGATLIREDASGLLDISLHGTWRDLENPLPFGFIGLDRLAGGTRATYSFTTLPFDLHAGTEFRIQNDRRFETDNQAGVRGDEIRVRQTETVLNQALFTRATVPLSDRWSLTAGLRADWIRFNADDKLGPEGDGSREFWSLNPSAGITYRFARSQWFANVSTSFETPTTTELVNRPEGATGFNQSLDPERTVGVETGLRGRLFGRMMEYDITTFFMRVNDILIPFQTEETGDRVFFANRGNTDHYGVETAIRATLNRTVSIDAMFTYLQAEFNDVVEGDTNLDGNTLPGVPDYRFGTSVQLSRWQMSLFWDMEGVGRMAVNNQNSAFNDAYTIHHLRWTTRDLDLGSATRIRPFVSLNNVFNKRYNTSLNINAAFGGFFFEPGSDRNLQAGFQLLFR
ncbi:MAG: TonB-dependent receptor [Balneolaceae bacterium]